MLENAELLGALAGADDIDDRQGPRCPLPGSVPDYAELAKRGARGLRIGVLAEGFGPANDPRVASAIRAAAERFSPLGATVTEVSVPMHSSGAGLWEVVGRLGAAAGVLGRSSGRKGLALPDLAGGMTQAAFDAAFVSVKHLVISGAYGWEHRAGLLAKATNLVRGLRDAYDAALANVDVLVLPTLPDLPARLPPPGAGLDDTMASGVGVTLHTAPFNLVRSERGWSSRNRRATPRSRCPSPWSRTTLAFDFP